MIQKINVRLLAEHPDNANFMNSGTLAKLRKHIEDSGRYEPLVVRPHPDRKDAFQILNGHNRLRVLRALGYAAVKCIIWDVDDALKLPPTSVRVKTLQEQQRI